MSAELESQVESLRRRLNITTVVAATGFVLAVGVGSASLLRPVPRLPSEFESLNAQRVVTNEIVTRGIGVVNDDGDTIAELVSTDGGWPSFKMVGKYGGTIEAGFSPGNPRTKNDNPKITLGPSESKSMVLLRAGLSGSGLSLGDGAGNPLVMMDAGSEGNSFISFKSAEQNDGYAQIGISPSGVPEIGLRNRDGKMIFEQQGKIGSPSLDASTAR